jgi:hypothetical protein
MCTYRSDPSGSPPFPPYRWLNEATTLGMYKRRHLRTHRCALSSLDSIAMEQVADVRWSQRLHEPQIPRLGRVLARRMLRSSAPPSSGVWRGSVQASGSVALTSAAHARRGALIWPALTRSPQARRGSRGVCSARSSGALPARQPPSGCRPRPQGDRGCLGNLQHRPGAPSP